MMEQDENTPSTTEEQSMEDVETEENGTWHPGPPAVAISLALSEGKFFLVWIRETTTSSDTADPPSSDLPLPTWQQIWSDEKIASILSADAICITLNQGTTDATMFLETLGSPTSTGVWIIFAGQLLDTFHTPPSVEEMRERISRASLQSRVLLVPPTSEQLAIETESRRREELGLPRGAALTSPSDSSIRDPEDAETRAKNEKIKQQLAARRAKLEAAKQKHGTPLHFPTIPPRLTFPVSLGWVNNRCGRKSITSCSSTKTSRINRPRTQKIYIPTRRTTSTR
jgi:hypothetical protein